MSSEAVSYDRTIGQDQQTISGTFVVERAHVIALGALFLLTRIVLLWYNEAEFTDAYEFIQWSFFQPAKRHPLYPLLIQLLSPFMDPILAGRFVSSLAGLFCLPALMGLTRRLYGDTAAMLCGLLFLVSAQVLFVNSRVLSESVFLAVTLASIFYFFRVLTIAGSAIDFSLLVLFSGLAILTRPEGIILIPLILVAIVSAVWRGLWKNLIYAVPTLLPWVLYFLWARSHAGYQSEFAFSFSSGTASKFLTYLFAYIDVYPYTAFFPVFLLAFVGLFRTCDSQRKLWLRILLYIHVAILLGVTVHQAWSTRFLLLPVTLILVEAAGTLLELSKKLSARLWGTLLFGIVLSSLIFAVMALYYQRETYADMKEVGIYLRKNMKEGRIFSDEVIKTSYYAGRLVTSYQPGTTYAANDIIVLHSFHTPIVSAFKRIQERHELEFLFTSESKITPLLANTLLERQRTNLPIAMTERFREQKFYSAVARVRSSRSK